MREAIRAALSTIAARFSDDAASIDASALRKRYVALDAWPADAQLGLVLLGWALGPGFALAGFREALNTRKYVVPDFARAGALVQAASLRSPNATLITLGAIAAQCFRNASTVVQQDLDPDILYYPQSLT